MRYIYIHFYRFNNHNLKSCRDAAICKQCIYYENLNFSLCHSVVYFHIFINTQGLQPTYTYLLTNMQSFLLSIYQDINSSFKVTTFFHDSNILLTVNKIINSNLNYFANLISCKICIFKAFLNHSTVHFYIFDNGNYMKNIYPVFSKYCLTSLLLVNIMHNNRTLFQNQANLQTFISKNNINNVGFLYDKSNVEVCDHTGYLYQNINLKPKLRMFDHICDIISCHKVKLTTDGISSLNVYIDLDNNKCMFYSLNVITFNCHVYMNVQEGIIASNFGYANNDLFLVIQPIFYLQINNVANININCDPYLMLPGYHSHAAYITWTHSFIHKFIQLLFCVPTQYFSLESRFPLNENLVQDKSVMASTSLWYNYLHFCLHFMTEIFEFKEITHLYFNDIAKVINNSLSNMHKPSFIFEKLLLPIKIICIARLDLYNLFNLNENATVSYFQTQRIYWNWNFSNTRSVYV